MRLSLNWKVSDIQLSRNTIFIAKTFFQYTRKMALSSNVPLNTSFGPTYITPHIKSDEITASIDVISNFMIKMTSGIPLFSS